MDHQQKDETAVAYLATAMNTKLARARAKGRSGWDTPECTQQHLSNLLREHVEKGDPVDVANYCAFLAARGEGIARRQCLAQIEEPAGAAPAAVAGPGWQAAADWLRNNYQDHPNIASLCDALVAAAPALEAPAAPETVRESDVLDMIGMVESGQAEEHDLLHFLKRLASENRPVVLAAAPQAPATAIPDEFGTAEHWKEKAQYWAGVAHRLRQEALRGGPVDGIVQPTAPQAPAAPVVDTSEPVLGEWPRVSGVGRDAESPRTLLLYLQKEASDDELRAIHDALLDGGALATHALSELMHIGYRVDGGKLVPPEKLSDCASEFFGVTAVAAKATAAHSDDLAVDRFATEMKSKLAAARAKGRGGWETCPPEVLSRMLREHADKGDPRDVANFCMFLWCLGQPIGAAPAAPAVDAWLQPDDMAALQRFHETAEDDESYDIGKEAVARLCAFGCLQSHSFGRYSTTDFGDYLLDTWAGARTLPFTTAAEREALAAQAAAKGA